MTRTEDEWCFSHPHPSFSSYTVARRHVNVADSLGIAKSEFSDRKGEDPRLPECTCAYTRRCVFPPELSHTCPAGFEAAHLFLKTREVPDVWKMDLSQILDSSSSDDSDDEEKESEEEEEEDDEDEKKKINKQMKDEVRGGRWRAKAECVRDGEGPNTEVCLCVSQMEEEQDPEERDQFLQQLYKFMEDRGQLHVCAITGMIKSKSLQSLCTSSLLSRVLCELI